MVLNGNGDKNGISKRTQERVIKEAKRLNYTPNQMARALRLGKTNTIGLIVSDISNAFYSKLARHIEYYARSKGYQVIFASSEEDSKQEDNLINMLLQHQVDGLIISHASKDHQMLRYLKKENIPFVLVDRLVPRFNLNYVGVDNYNGAFQLTEHLIQLKYQKIGVLKISPSDISTMKERTEGYRDALKKYKTRFHQGFIKTIDYQNIRTETELAIRNLLSPPHIADAIIAFNNHIAVACLEVFRDNGIRVPQDIALVSFDDLELFRFSDPPVTAVRQPIGDIGTNAVEVLLDQIQAIKEGKTFEYKKIVLPVEIKVRRSCGNIGVFH